MYTLSFDITNLKANVFKSIDTKLHLVVDYQIKQGLNIPNKYNISQLKIHVKNNTYRKVLLET